MATQTRAPSRALIHALRGILFTTSCSVLLLAEERRRRIKLARTAIDNARKLHTAKSRRRPVQLSEGRAPYDYVDQLPDSTETNRFLKWGRDTSKNTQAETPKAGTPKRRGAEDHDVSLDWKSHIVEYLAEEPAGAKQIPSTLFPAQFQSLALEQRQRKAKLDRRNVNQAKTTSLYKQTKLTLTSRNVKSDKLSETLPIMRSEEDVQAAVSSIQSMLQELANPDCSTDDMKKIAHRALALLREEKRLSNQAIPKVLLATTPELFDVISKRLPAYLTRLLQILVSCRSPSASLMPLVTHIVEKDDWDVVWKLARCLSQYDAASWTNSRTPRWILVRYGKTQPDFGKLKRLYQVLQDVGRFTGASIEHENEFAARCYMLSRAVEAGDEEFAYLERKTLRKLDGAAVQAKIQLYDRLAREKAARGDWLAAVNCARFVRFFSIPQTLEFSATLDAVLEQTEASHPENTENVLRALFENFGTKMTSEWAWVMMDRYSSAHDISGLCSWLEFCKESGLEVSQYFVDYLYKRCRKYWSFSSKDFELLDESLRKISPSIAETCWTPRIPSLHERRHVAKGSEKRTPLSNSTLFGRMSNLMEADQWEKAYELFEPMRSQKIWFDPSVFRLAIQCRMKLDGGNTAFAGELIHWAHEQGYDISEALTQFLLGRLNEGVAAQTLLNTMLGLGIRIHNSTYNVAAKRLRDEGKNAAAISVCKLAGKENGKGNLAYNQYNFSNLVFLFTANEKYVELRDLVLKFISENHFWQGSKVCKEAIKWAMKTVGRRCLEEERPSHRRAMDALDRALVHVKAMRAGREERSKIKEQVESMAASCHLTKGASSATTPMARRTALERSSAASFIGTLHM